MTAAPTEYLATFLASPIGQARLSAHIYGAVVEEPTEDHVRGVRVPVPSTPKEHDAVREIHELAMRSLRLRAEAVRATEQAARSLESFLPQPQVEPESGAGVTDDYAFGRFERLASGLLQVSKDEIAGAGQ